MASCPPRPASQEQGTKSKKMPYFKLNSGHSIPAVGLGTWIPEPCKSKEDTAKAVEIAIREGYRHIDCAHQYGNEDEVGKAVQKVIQEGVVKREDLFITSKLWNTDHVPGDVKGAAQRTMKDLQITYLDLYLMHWPTVQGCKGPTVQPTLAETYKAMEALMDEGLVRSIGVANFSNKKTSDLLQTCRIKPAVNQVEMHPYFRNDGILKFCNEQGIHVTAYAPLSTPASQSENKAEDAPNVLEEPLVKMIAYKHHKQPAQVVIRWAIQRGTSVLPKSTTPEHIKANLDVVGWELDKEEFEALSSFEKQVRVLDAAPFLDPEGPYKTERDMWDE